MRWSYHESRGSLCSYALWCFPALPNAFPAPRSQKHTVANLPGSPQGCRQQKFTLSPCQAAGSWGFQRAEGPRAWLKLELSLQQSQVPGRAVQLQGCV